MAEVLFGEQQQCRRRRHCRYRQQPSVRLGKRAGRWQHGTTAYLAGATGDQHRSTSIAIEQDITPSFTASLFGGEGYRLEVHLYSSLEATSPRQEAPEPSILALLNLGLLGMAARREGMR